ncbi:adhesion G-protein coupled receptor G7-like isoform X2 [Antedon mediterranea]|uniref:adhesion G-protein coupled receptor G7-like isoform X2 n=1 Tax=Antedon mediterranea TaxID=105859 RepID=UPI003AF6CFBE
MELRIFMCILCFTASLNGERVRRKAYIPNFNDKCWTPWLDDERLGISTDSDNIETEKLSTFRRHDSSLVCSDPERIECRRVVDKIPSGNEVSRCDVTYGLKCIDRKDIECADYEIRILCPTPCHPNGTRYALTSTVSPVDFMLTTGKGSDEPIATVDVGLNTNTVTSILTDLSPSKDYYTNSYIQPTLKTTEISETAAQPTTSKEPIQISETYRSTPFKTSINPSISTDTIVELTNVIGSTSQPPSFVSHKTTSKEPIQISATYKSTPFKTSINPSISTDTIVELTNVIGSTSQPLTTAIEQPEIEPTILGTNLSPTKTTEHMGSTTTQLLTHTEATTTESTAEISTQFLETERFIGCKYSKVSNLTWRRVEINKYRSSEEKCPEGTPRAGMPKGTRYCGTDDDGNALWMSPNIEDCLQSRATTPKMSYEEREKEIVNLSEATITLENVSAVADDLTALTNGVDVLSVEMLNAIADTLDNIVNVGSTSLQVTEAVFSTVSNLLSAEFGEGSDVASSSTKIVRAVDTQVSSTQQGQDSFQVKDVNLAVLASTNNRSVLEGGLGFASFSNDNTGLENTKWRSFQNENAVPLSGIDVSCKIPEEIGNYVGSDNLQLSYVIYSNGMLFSSPTTSGATSEVMSRVLSVSVKDTEVTNLRNPIEISFGIPPNKSNYQVATCVYWDFNLQDGIGDWSSDGCFMNVTNDNIITCFCNHLTHFSVLLEFKQRNLDPDVQFVLILISKVGCLVSIVCLIATLVAFLSFRRLRNERPQRILISLSVSLLCLYIMFIIGIEPGDERTDRQMTKCMISATLIHYFTLTSIFWMVVEAVNLYYNLIKVFKSKVSLFMLKASLFAWGVPGIIVGGMAGWETTRKEYMNDQYCFMKIGFSFYVSIALPVAVCLLFNIIVFMRVMCHLCRRTRTQNTSESFWRNLSKRTQNAFGISILLGLTWIFGFLTFDIEHDYIFDLFFCIFNSMQGVCVFIFFCVRQKDVRITWKRFCCGQKRASYNVGSSSASSTRYTNRSGRPESANIDLFAKSNSQMNGRVAMAIYDYNNAIC